MDLNKGQLWVKLCQCFKEPFHEGCLKYVQTKSKVASKIFVCKPRDLLFLQVSWDVNHLLTKGSERHHFRCFIKARGPREKQGHKITRGPVFVHVQELDQPSFWVLKLEPKPHHQKVTQKMLSLVRGTGHKQQAHTLPPHHQSFGSEQAQALHPASVQGLKFP